MDRLAENIASIREARLAILDGGFATHLEDAYGQDLSGRLWSASLTVVCLTVRLTNHSVCQLVQAQQYSSVLCVMILKPKSMQES